MHWWLLFGVLLKAVLFSSGGLGPLPILHDDFMTLQWAAERHFTEALAIGQLTPGPNGLWVVSLCYMIDGGYGAALACLALALPPFLALLVQNGYERLAHLAAVQGFLDGLVLVILGFSMSVLTTLFFSNGYDALLLGVVCSSLVAALSRRVPINLILLGAGIIGYYWG